MTNRSIENLKSHELVVGAEIATLADLEAGDKLILFGEQFKVLGVLPTTGTVDDSRVFAHLHTVQRLTDSGPVCNAIEVIGCCEDAAGALTPELRKLLPQAKVVTISQVVQTQVGVNRQLANTSWFIFGVLVLVGGASLASSIAANVRERRREIGTLMALGATPWFVQRVFLGKAVALGLCAGAIGSLTGVATALLAGPTWAGVQVSVLPGTSLIAVGVAMLLAFIAAWWPSRVASQLDPCVCFQEV